MESISSIDRDMSPEEMERLQKVGLKQAVSCGGWGGLCLREGGPVVTLCSSLAGGGGGSGGEVGKRGHGESGERSHSPRTLSVIYVDFPFLCTFVCV